MDSKSRGLVMGDILNGFNGPDGIEVYDFGDGIQVMPVMDATVFYTTSSICFLVKRGKGQLEVAKQMLRNTLADLGNGWKIFGVEFNCTTSPEDFRKMLETAKAKLLEA